MKYDKMNRRLFVQGLGGLLVAMPTLPSLMEKTYAQTTASYNKRFFTMMTAHDFSMHDLFLNAQPHLVQGQGFQSLDVSQNLSQYAPLLGADFQRHASKLSFIQGLNLGQLGHNTTGTMGNVAGSNKKDVLPEPTIDYIMARHRGLSVEKILRMGTEHRSITSDGDPTHYEHVSLPLSNGGNPFIIFQNHFTNLPAVPVNTLASKKKLVDYIKEDVSNSLLRRGFLSQADKVIVQNQLDFISDIQTRYSGAAVAGPTCAVNTQFGASLFNEPAGNIAGAQNIPKFNQYISDSATLIASAFKCNIFTLANYYTTYSSVRGSMCADYDHFTWKWHDQIAHQVHPEWTSLLMEVNIWNLKNLFLNIVAQLDVPETSDGTTFLDNSILAWASELGGVGHCNSAQALILAGKGGGTLNPGKLWDFGDSTKRAEAWYLAYGNKHVVNSPTPYNRYWNSILQSWGMKPANYEKAGRAGYGHSSHLTDGDSLQQQLVGTTLPGLFKIPA